MNFNFIVEYLMMNTVLDSAESWAEWWMNRFDNNGFFVSMIAIQVGTCGTLERQNSTFYTMWCI